LIDLYPFLTFPTSVSSFFPTGTTSPVKWIDLYGDQCSVYYSFGSTAINRFNVCQIAELAPFTIAAPGRVVNDFRIRPNGQVVVANENEVTLLNSDGTVALTFGLGLSPSFNAVSLDPDGTSVWVGDKTGQIFHFDIATGQSLLAKPIVTNFSSVNGLALVGEIRAGTLPAPTCTLSVTPSAGVAPLMVTANGSCQSQNGPITTYSIN